MKTKSKTFFNPDEIVTTISQNLRLDLSRVDLLYDVGLPYQRYFKEVQCDSILKKYVSPSADVTGLEKEAFELFIRSNRTMERINENFSPPDTNKPARYRSDIESVLIRARWLVHRTLSDITTEEVYRGARNSSGVTVGIPFTDTSVDRKLNPPFSCTAGVDRLFWDYLTWDKSLKDGIEAAAFGEVNYFTKLYGGEPRSLTSPFDFSLDYEIVDGSKATTVPKSNDKVRMIAIEPTLNMFFQQGLMTVMYSRLKSIGLDVTTLPFTHMLKAQEGSISASYATLDFSSASDSVSIELLRWLLPPKWFSWIWSVRCHKMMVDGSWMPLGMISTMGNATTFPLETLVFWAIAAGTVCTVDESNPNRLPLDWTLHDCSVFGDDCILPERAVDLFTEVVTNVGFSLNKEKSFRGVQKFRESCGGDYLSGRGVRPLCIKAPTSLRKSALEPWLYIILNGILKKYVSYFGPTKYCYESKALEYLFSLFRQYNLKVKIVPLDFPDDAGLKTPDYHRLRSCYDFPCSKVTVDVHGVVNFAYCKFRYWDMQTRSDDLRIALWYKEKLGRKLDFFLRSEDQSEDRVLQLVQFNPLDKRLVEEPHTMRPIRRKGGYLVARTSSVRTEDFPVRTKA